MGDIMALKLSGLFSFFGLGRLAIPEISGLVATGTFKNGYPCYQLKDPQDKVKGTAEGSYIQGADDICFNSRTSTALQRRRLSDPSA